MSIVHIVTVCFPVPMNYYILDKLRYRDFELIRKFADTITYTLDTLTPFVHLETYISLGIDRPINHSQLVLALLITRINNAYNYFIRYFIT
jgi:hypothetical protein